MLKLPLRQMLRIRDPNIGEARTKSTFCRQSARADLHNVDVDAGQVPAAGVRTTNGTAGK
jgi:hypothetical protein